MEGSIRLKDGRDCRLIQLRPNAENFTTGCVRTFLPEIIQSLMCLWRMTERRVTPKKNKERTKREQSGPRVHAWRWVAGSASLVRADKCVPTGKSGPEFGRYPLGRDRKGAFRTFAKMTNFRHSPFGLSGPEPYALGSYNRPTQPRTIVAKGKRMERSERQTERLQTSKPSGQGLLFFSRIIRHPTPATTTIMVHTFVGA